MSLHLFNSDHIDNQFLAAWLILLISACQVLPHLGSVCEEALGNVISLWHLPCSEKDDLEVIHCNALTYQCFPSAMRWVRSKSRIEASQIPWLPWAFASLQGYTLVMQRPAFVPAWSLSLHHDSGAVWPLPLTASPHHQWQEESHLTLSSCCFLHVPAQLPWELLCLGAGFGELHSLSGLEEHSFSECTMKSRCSWR